MIVLALSAALLVTPAEVPCGTKQLYGRSFELYAHNVPCEQVAAVSAGPCGTEGHPWFCHSAAAPGPALYWRLENERYAQPTAWIEARRPSCSRSKVTRKAWDRARKRVEADPFPTELQLLSDDLIRCKQLRGKSRRAVLKLLRGGGLGGESYDASVSWRIGPERNLSVPDPADGEYFGVVFTRKGKVKSVGIDTI